MKKHIKPLKIGSLTLSNNIIYAPLAGCSDYPFRQMSALYKPGLMYCEMVKMEALIRHDPCTYHLLDFDSSMGPIGAQLCGSNPKIAGASAKIIEELGFDVLDLNCGCPVDKVTKDGSGSGMLKNPELIGEVLSEMISAVKIPVTLKIRIGWDSNTINAKEITRIGEKVGAKLITIHGRTREQQYKGKANWDTIRECKKEATTIKVIGNGDVFDAHSGIALLNHTGCDGILVSRGTMGQPWIAEAIRRLDEGLAPLLLTPNDYRDILLKHMTYIFSYQPNRRAVVDMRRVGCWYLRNGKGTKKLREGLNSAKELIEIENLINTYDWEQTSFSTGVIEQDG